MEEKLYRVKKSHSPLGILIRHQECKGCKDTTNTSYIGAAISWLQTTQYTYLEGPSLLYISFASPELTKQDRYQETLEAAGDKRPKNKKLTKVNESMQCMERGLQEEPVEYGVLMPLMWVWHRQSQTKLIIHTMAVRQCTVNEKELNIHSNCIGNKLNLLLYILQVTVKLTALHY